MPSFSYDDQKTQATGGSYGADLPTEVVGGGRPSLEGQPFRSDATIVRSSQQRDPSFAWLVVVKGRRLGDILRVNKGDTGLGREADNDVVVDDDYCSRRHAKIRLEPDSDVQGEQAFFIYDLATPNHTFVNGEEILKVKLTDGDKVQIGETVMVFKKV